MATGERINSSAPSFFAEEGEASDNVSLPDQHTGSPSRLDQPNSPKGLSAGLGTILVLSLILLALVLIPSSWAQLENSQSALFQDTQLWRLILGVACIALIVAMCAFVLVQLNKLGKNHRAEMLAMTARFELEKRDLIVRQRAEATRARSADQVKTSFLAHLNHNVRTPLNHIIGFAELIRRQAHGDLGDKRYLEYLDNIQSSGENLLDSFSSILELAELEEGVRPVKTEIVDVLKLVESVGQKYRARTQQAGIALEIVGPEDVHVHTDRYGVIRMLGNLVDNAVKFTPRGGKVSLCAWQATDGIAFEIADSGIGIPELRLRELGTPFFTHELAFENAKGKQLGLGLPIARAIAESNGGQLVIDSMLSIGTTVAVSLPCAIADTSSQIQAA